MLLVIVSYRMQKLIHIFQMALRDARSNLLHTILSVLGIVIGVGALVAILSLIDGMEKYATQQIGQTTTLNSIIISPQVNERVNGVLIRKKEIPFIRYSDLPSIDSALGKPHTIALRYAESGWLTDPDSSFSIGMLLRGIVAEGSDKVKLSSGRFLNSDDLDAERNVAMINAHAADMVDSLTGTRPEPGKRLLFNNRAYNIIGVVGNAGDQPEIYVPITAIASDLQEERPPACVIDATTVEDVNELEGDIRQWITGKFGSDESFQIFTNAFRVKQANQAFLIFRIVMGLIVGISVIVGGIGIMNVLLISVTERTREIGIRKAIGARRKDIVLQFIAESLTVSAIGSILGLILGILFTSGAVPIVRRFTELPFEAVYTWNTFVVIALVSILIGIAFGTYPALKAARLDPVAAIRHE